MQLIGVAALPYFYVKYAVEGDSIVDDLGAAAVRSNKDAICLLHPEKVPLDDCSCCVPCALHAAGK